MARSKVLLLSACGVALSFLVGSLGVLSQDQGRGQRRRRDAAKDETSKPADLDGWGKLGSARKGEGGFYEFTLYRRNERGKVQTSKLLLKVPETLSPFLDRRVRIEDLKEGEQVYVFGRPEKREAQYGGGRGGGGGGGRGGGGAGRRGTDLQIKASRVVLSGKGLKVNEKYKDRRDARVKWCKGMLTRDGVKGLWMNYENANYRVALDARSPVLKRQQVEKKFLRRGVYLQVEASTTAERPADEKKSDAKKECYVAEKLVILDSRSIRTVYPAVVRN